MNYDVWFFDCEPGIASQAVHMIITTCSNANSSDFYRWVMEKSQNLLSSATKIEAKDTTEIRRDS